LFGFWELRKRLTKSYLPYEEDEEEDYYFEFEFGDPEQQQVTCFDDESQCYD